MIIRARFYVSSVTHLARFGEDPVAKVEMFPAPDGDGARASYSKDVWANKDPEGKVEMTINNPSLIASIEAGMVYFLEFRPVR